MAATARRRRPRSHGRTDVHQPEGHDLARPSTRPPLRRASPAHSRQASEREQHHSAVAAVSRARAATKTVHGVSATTQATAKAKL